MADSKGFTLIELMIVVSIIGILASMAVPNFLAYRARARQTEVWINFGGIYTSQIAHIGPNASYGDAYTGGPGAIGFSILGTPQYRYDMSGAGGSVVSIGSSRVCATSPTSVGGGMGSTFQVIACNNIDGDNTVDEWTMVSPNPTPIAITNDVTQ